MPSPPAQPTTASSSSSPTGPGPASAALAASSGLSRKVKLPHQPADEEPSSKAIFSRSTLANSPTTSKREQMSDSQPTQSKTEPDEEPTYTNTQPTSEEAAKEIQEEHESQRKEEQQSKRDVSESAQTQQSSTHTDDDSRTGSKQDREAEQAAVIDSQPTSSERKSDEKPAKDTVSTTSEPTSAAMQSVVDSQPTSSERKADSQPSSGADAKTSGAPQSVIDSQPTSSERKGDSAANGSQAGKTGAKSASSGSKMIYNVHAPEHSFALTSRGDSENASSLLARIAKKSGLSVDDQLALQSARNSAAGVKYEHRGERFDLEDDEDLEVLRERFPEGETEAVTLHIVLPGGQHHGQSGQSQGAQPSQQQGGDRPVPSAARSVRSTASRITGGRKTIHAPTGSIIDLDVSTRGETQAQESLGDKHKRLWKDFHDNNGVRTVVGKVGDVEGVRMLLKPGYSAVYVSRAFASEHGFIPKSSAMGTYGYAGLVSLGQLPITVGSKTASHKVMLSEESNFDVVLGRAWAEKMGVKTDGADQTSVTYMDNGEQIPCDIVVLKDAKGEIITVT